MSYQSVESHRSKYCAGLAFAASMVFGLVEVSSASTCTLGDVTLGGMDATTCGWGTTNNDFVSPPASSWQVNLDDAGNINPDDWVVYNKWDFEGSPNFEGSSGGSLINLDNVTPTGGTNPNTTGTFTVNTSDPMLVVLKEGAGGGGFYHWYYFEGKSGDIGLGGTWDTTVPFDGRDLSHLSVYAAPIPAAAWLFGSGLLGLVGIARRKRS